MKTLYTYITEGGAAGHMAHPYDYDDFMLRDIKGLIRDLFTAKIEDVTEKIDGMNIVASMNTSGDVIFIRNKADLNSPRGGMNINGMINKWSDRPHVAETYTAAATLITAVFNKIGKDFFNPDNNTRIAVNCECVNVGVTNIIPYGSAMVNFHDLFIYKLIDGEWKHTSTTKDNINILNDACDGVDGAQLTPRVLIAVTKDSQNILVSFIKDIDRLWKSQSCSEYDTVGDYKLSRFRDYCSDNAPWILDGDYTVLYNRWINGNRTVNIRKIKQMYANHVGDVTALDRDGNKDLIRYVNEPLDTFFARLGNSVIKQCTGFANAGIENDVISRLRQDLDDVVSIINTADDEQAHRKLDIQLRRLQKLGNVINSTEGIVFRYKGKLMKCTGSFASLNKIINFKYMGKI